MSEIVNSQLVEWGGHTFHVVGETFAPRTSSLFIPEIVYSYLHRITTNMQLIELCAGSGALGISTTLKNAHYVKKLLLLDNKPDAILSADMNLKKHEVEGVSRLPSTEFGRPKIARR